MEEQAVALGRQADDAMGQQQKDSSDLKVIRAVDTQAFRFVDSTTTLLLGLV